MQLPGESIGVFYRDELPRINTKIVTRDTGPHATWMSSAVMREYSRTRKTEWSTGLEGLKGCTALYIISRKAVYATHWRENVSFEPDQKGREPADQTNDELFRLTVIEYSEERRKIPC